MEPITAAIVAALAAGAAAAAKDTAGAAVKDAYAGLKGFIQRKYGRVDIAQVERKPDSEAKRESVAKDLAEAGATNDAELQELARALVKAIERNAPRAAPAIGVDLENVKAAFLRVGSVDSTGTGVKARDSEFREGIDIGPLRAGGAGPANP